MNIERKKTREVKIGKLRIGGNNPISVQSMCNTLTKDTDTTIKQIHCLEEAGCEIVRVAIPDIESAESISDIKKNISIPLVADIHYDHKLALECLKREADKIRINPGNIPKEKIKIIIKAAKDYDKPVRIGVNIGSLPKHVTKKLGYTTKAVVESAFDTIKLFEELDFYNTVVSLKSSDVLQNIEANLRFSEKSDYPLHLGVTEAGTIKSGMIKSSIGISYLLMKGVGDTIRMSLTADPVEEVLAAHTLLRSLGLREGATLASCPVCGRAKIDVIKTAEEIEKKLVKIRKPVKVGVMGCFVNVEEAKMADIGIAGAGRHGILFKNGKMIRKVEKDKLVEELMKEINNLPEK